MTGAFSWAPYTRQFYEDQTTGRSAFEVEQLAYAIYQTFQPRTVADVGCGRGAFLKLFHEAGCEVWGTDGAPVKEAGLVISRSLFLEQDFRDGLRIPIKRDVILCLEVVEHLPADVADDVVRSICRSGATHIVFSGAIPGQGGTGHINERPVAYWVSKFREQGRNVDSLSTDFLLNQWLLGIGEPETCGYYAKNLRCFR